MFELLSCLQVECECKCGCSVQIVWVRSDIVERRLLVLSVAGSVQTVWVRSDIFARRLLASSYLSRLSVCFSWFVCERNSVKFCIGDFMKISCENRNFVNI